jgi:hypothetical protein
MKIISHRGNINGAIPDRENRPSYIDCAINLGYDVEVDIRFINGQFWLGHDEPQYKIELSWMTDRKNKIWYHCKDISSAIILTELNDEYQFFCHFSDKYVLTSIGKLWVHDLDLNLGDTCIIPLLTIKDIDNYSGNKPFAICTDFVKLTDNKFNTKTN